MNAKIVEWSWACQECCVSYIWRRLMIMSTRIHVYVETMWIQWQVKTMDLFLHFHTTFQFWWMAVRVGNPLSSIFFFINNNVYWSKLVPEYILKEQWSKNSTREVKENNPETDIQSNRVRKKIVFKAKLFLSLSSKVCSFLCLHMHHIKQWGIAFQISIFQCRPNPPCQQSNKSTTRLSITQCIPKRDKTISHNSLATLQWRNR